MHGQNLSLHPRSKGKKLWDRNVIDDSLDQGHALATGDFMGSGSDQIEVGWRGTSRAGKVGVKFYYPTNEQRTEWKSLLIDDNEMATEDIRVADLNAIAIEELEHFQLVLDILADRGVPFSHPISSPWISGLMGTIRKGRHEQVIDHLLCAALIEGRSCEKFQLLAGALGQVDAPLAKFYADLVESEGNHYAAYLLMAKEIDEAETNNRLDFYLDLDAELVQQPSDLPILH